MNHTESTQISREDEHVDGANEEGLVRFASTGRGFKGTLAAFETL